MTQEMLIARREERKALRLAKKETERIQAEMAQKPVKSITISISWHKSRTWGNNPNAEAEVEFADGNFECRDGFKCSGCGYDKESTVIGKIFNTYMLYKLWEKVAYIKKYQHETTYPRKVPYGINHDDDKHVSYGQGVGTNCYTNIGKFIDGKFETIASGKTFDVYKWTSN